jgi:uncharacterized GH25 family protein
MKSTLSVVVFLTLVVPVVAHDMFLVVPDHDLAPNSAIEVSLYNGTIDKSENTIDRDRMTSVTVVDGAGQATHPGDDQWSEQGNVTILSFDAGAPGTHVVGVSTKSRIIELSAEDFNEYLEHDGVLDVLGARRKDGSIDADARELYSKHVKTILQVGDRATESWSQRLGYPIEIVPSANPVELCAGDELAFSVLTDAGPATDQLFYASYEGHHGHDDSGTHREAISGRTDSSGVGRFEVLQEGRWYVRIIRMLESSEAGVDYESNWATLTFEVSCRAKD